MSPPKKQRRTGSPYLQTAIDRAIAALQDPRVQAEIAKHGRAMAGQVQEWVKEHPPSEAAKGIGDHLVAARHSVRRSVGQGKLEARVTNLRAAVDRLVEVDPALKADLAPVVSGIEKTSRSLLVSAALPLVKRKKAHYRIDKDVDRLERALFQASLGNDSAPDGAPS